MQLGRQNNNNNKKTHTQKQGTKTNQATQNP